MSDEVSYIDKDFLITREHINPFLALFQNVDLFAFIPFPKDEPVSTKRSLIGTVLFLIIFGSYVIADFVNFLVNNPPQMQSYRVQLDQATYDLPNLAIAFVQGELNNQTDYYNNLFTYEWLEVKKTQGKMIQSNISWTYVTYQNNTESNFDKLPWISQSTKKFYSILRTPTSPLQAKGLLYSSQENQIAKIKLYFCTGRSDCLDNQTMIQKSNHGRLFVFIEEQRDKSPLSRQKPNQNGNNFRLYNFYVIPQYYKRITFHYQVVRTTTLPDYFYRFTETVDQRVIVSQVEQRLSQVTYNNTHRDAISFQLQLSQSMLDTRVTCQTLLDRVSLWGAFFGVLFSIFTLIFVSHNSKKFYKKNPDWKNFMNTLQRQTQALDRIVIKK